MTDDRLPPGTDRFKPLARHGAWLVAEIEDSGLGMAERCIALTIPVLQASQTGNARVDVGDMFDTVPGIFFGVTASHAFFGYRPGLGADARVIFELQDEGQVPMVHDGRAAATFLPGHDFAVIASLANTSAELFGVILEQGRNKEALVFIVSGLREAYAALAERCDFDATLVLNL